MTFPPIKYGDSSEEEEELRFEESTMEIVEEPVFELGKDRSSELRSERWKKTRRKKNVQDPLQENQKGPSGRRAYGSFRTLTWMGQDLAAMKRRHQEDLRMKHEVEKLHLR